MPKEEFKTVGDEDVKQLDLADKKAEEILSSEDPLYSLKVECLDKRIIGEDKNKQLVIILLTSGKMKKVDLKLLQIIVLAGTPAGGKTAMANTSRFFNVKEVGRFTEHAIDYSDLSGFDIIYIKEMGNIDDERQGVSTVKFLSTEDGGYTIEYTVRDDETKRFTTEQRKIPPMTLILTTPRFKIDNQFDRRAWLINPDESKEQTERILKFKEELERQNSEVYLGKRPITDYDFSGLVLQKVIEKIEPHKVIVPYPSSITKVLNSSHLRTRGDFDKISALIKLTSLFYQRKLPYKMINGEKVLLATPEIFYKVLDISSEPLTTMSLEIDSRIRKLLICIKNKGLKDIGSEIHKQQRVEIASELNQSEKSIYRFLELMRDLGYIATYDDEGKGTPKYHKLLMSVDDIFSKASGINDLSKTVLKTPQSLMSQEEKSQNETFLDFDIFLRQNDFAGYTPISIRLTDQTPYTAEPICLKKNDNMKQALKTQDNAVSQKVSQEDISDNYDIKTDTLPNTDKACSDCTLYKDNACTKHPDLKVLVPTAKPCPDFILKESA